MEALVSSKEQTKVKDLRSELKLLFPTTTFNISSSLKGDKLTIGISYIDGPSQTRVRSVSRQFAYGYTSEDNYINVRMEVYREMSDKTKKLLMSEMKSIWKIKGQIKSLDYCPQVNSTVGHYIQTIFNMRDF